MTKPELDVLEGEVELLIVENKRLRAQVRALRLQAWLRRFGARGIR